MISDAVYGHLANSAGVSALCSEIHSVVRPLDAGPPFIVFTLDADDRMRLLDGTEAAYRHALVSVDVYATTLGSAMSIADAVESAMTDYQGVLGTTSPQVDANHVRLERRGPHIFEPDTDLYHVPLEFFIGYEV